MGVRRQWKLTSEYRSRCSVRRTQRTGQDGRSHRLKVPVGSPVRRSGEEEREVEGSGERRRRGRRMSSAAGETPCRCPPPPSRRRVTALVTSPIVTFHQTLHRTSLRFTPNVTPNVTHYHCRSHGPSQLVTPSSTERHGGQWSRQSGGSGRSLQAADVSLTSRRAGADGVSEACQRAICNKRK